jgi:xylan 1,4-beta-xylosidase
MKDIRFEVDCDMSSIHFHDEMEIMYVLSGRIAVMMKGSNYVLSSEDMVVFNCFEYHEHYKEPGCHVLSMFISPDVLQDAQMGDIRCNSRINLEQADYFKLLRTKLAIIYKEYTGINTSQINRLAILSHLYDLLSMLKMYFAEEGEKREINIKEMDRIRKVLFYVHDHFTEDINLQEIADMVYWSKGHLSREFQKQIGVKFSDYLRNLRLNKAAYMLRTTQKSVTEIALACGFVNTNTMIVNFHNEYHETPGAYQKKHSEELDKYNEVKIEGTLSYMPLLKHLPPEANLNDAEKKKLEVTMVNVDLNKAGAIFKPCQNEAVFVGYAKDLLMENMRNAVRRAVREIGFQYGIISGIFDDSMDVYHENEDGLVYFSFTYIDMVLDLFVSIGLKPWLEFGNMPLKLADGKPNLFGSSYINLPNDMDKWKSLLEATIAHILARYGYEECQTWRYAVMNGAYSAYNLFDLDDYMNYWRESYILVKALLPNARINGWTLDTGVLRKCNGEPLIHFIDYCRKMNCMPDEFAVQIFQSDYEDYAFEDTEEKITNGTGQQKEEPSHINANPNILSEDLSFVRKILDEHGAKEYPLIVSRWNSTTWQGELSNDTCFKAAFAFKGYIENEGKTNCLCFASLTDVADRSLTNVGMYFGGLGLMTYQGIPKAGYYAIRLLNEIAGIMVAKGEGYVVTRSEDGKRFQIAIYNYCHYDFEKHMESSLSQEEQRTHDRYYGFVDSSTRTFQFKISGLSEGDYDKESFIVSREHGSSYDLWMKMGTPDLTTGKQYEYLDHKSEPDYRYDKVYVGGEREFAFSVSVQPHEVELICMVKE